MGLPAVSVRGVGMSALHAVPAASSRADGEIAGPRPALVPAGTYEVVYLYDETIILAKGANKGRGVPKLVLWFKVISPGEAFDAKLPAYYNVDQVEGRPRRYGGFKVGWRSNFMRDYATLFGEPARRNRIPMSRFEGCVIRAKVRTVMSTWKQKPLPAALHYSVIDELLSTTTAPTPAPSPTPAVTPRPTASPTPTLK